MVADVVVEVVEVEVLIDGDGDSLAVRMCSEPEVEVMQCAMADNC